MTPSEKSPSPQFQKYAVSDALAVFEDREDYGRPLTADDITTALGWSRRTAHNKLTELVDRGDLRTRKVGARARVWWVPLDADTGVPGERKEPADTVLSASGQERMVSPTTEQYPATAEEVLEHIRDELRGRTEEDRLERSAAILTAYQFLQEHGDSTFGKAHIKEIKEHTFSEHPTGRDRETQWENYLRKGLLALPGVEPAHGTSGMWYFLPSSHPVAEKLDTTDIEAQIAEIVAKGEGASESRHRAMIQLAYNHIKKKGHATKDDLERVLPDYYAHYAGYDVFWSYSLRDALKLLDGIVPPPRGAGEWQYVSSELEHQLDVEIEEWVREHDLGVKGDGEVAKRQRQMFQLAYNHLKRQGESTKNDIEEALPDYTVHYAGFDGLWGYFLKDALREAPGIETKKQGQHGGILYQYADE